MIPTISVICPTTRIGGLDILFSTLEMQTYKKFELILVDALYDYRKDLVQELSAKASFKVKHISQPKTFSTFSRALNNGFVNAEGQFVYILPDYTWMKSNCLQIHITFHTSYKPGNYALVGRFDDCHLPPLHKDFYRPYASNVPYYREKPNNFLEEERKNFNNYIEDLNSGKLNNLMYSIFEQPFTIKTNPDLFQISIPKEHVLEGPVDSNKCIFKNESYEINTILKINGANEALDGSHGWADVEFADRLKALMETTLYHKPEAIVWTINPRIIMYARSRDVGRDVFSNEAIWKKEIEDNFKTSINTYSLQDKRSQIIHTTKTPYITVICPTMRIGGLDTVFNSLENQTFKDFELILSDSLYNYRKDIVEEMGRSYTFKYKHISPINDKFPIFSQAHGTNSAIVQAEGKIILFVTDYRYFMPWTLQMHYDFHEANADNIGYAPGSKFLLPPEIKPGIPRYGRNTDYDKYVDDLKAGKLKEFMWSIFANDPFKEPQDLSSWPEIDRLNIGYDPKTIVLKGTEVPPSQIFLQSESVKTKLVLEANGLNESLDGAFNYVDIEFAHRLRNLFDLKWIGDHTNVIYRVTGGDHIVNKAKLIPEVQDVAESIFKKYESGSKDPVNNWNLADIYKNNNERKK